MDVEIAYNRALDYLYGFVDYSLKHASELAKADFNLDRMFALMSALGNPQERYPIIHVAGTKGKGSVCAMIASALHAAGYQAGLFTSPHLQDYAERIQINGVPMSHADLADMVEAIKPQVALIPKLTTFEITTALGFLYFARQGVNAAVIEVGLGGRLDATNVVLPQVSVITSLSFDHMAVLGDTLAAIAGEKAGIIKEGRPVVSAPQREEALLVLERVARERSAPLTLVGRDVLFSAVDHSLDGQKMEVWTPGKSRLALDIPLLGAYQVENAATAYTALLEAGRMGMPVAETAMQDGFSRTNWPARFEIVRRAPPVILDSAHNEDSFIRLRQALDEYFPGYPVILIFGASEDKNISEMFAVIKPRLERILVTRADHPRALSPEGIAQLAEQVGIQAEVVTPVSAALHTALQLAGKKSLVLSAGSIFVTAEVRTAWQQLHE